MIEQDGGLLGSPTAKVEVYALKVDPNLASRSYATLLSFVSQEKCERIRRFYKYEDSLRTLLGDVLARYLICQKTKLANEQLQFGKNEYGKPYLINDPGVGFNISHSGDWVVCALGDFPLGVDVEKVAPVDMAIGERFFARDEYAMLLQKTGRERLLFFYEIWTMKESYIKARGRGLSLPLETFSVVDGFAGIGNEMDSSKLYFKKYDLNAEYKVAVCAGGAEFADRIRYVEVAEVETGLR